MKRNRMTRRSRIGRDSEPLLRLAAGLAASSSRIEDGFWESRLSAQVDRLLKGGNDDALNAALDQLYAGDARAYDELADVIESRVESGALSVADGEWDVLLFAAPILAWSRYAIPAASLSPTLLANLRVQLGAHVFAASSRLALCDHLFSPDQLPAGYADTWRLAARLASATVAQHDVAVDARLLNPTQDFISDCRYVLGAVSAPRGMPLFRWQEEGGSRQQAEEQWRTQGGPCLQSLFAGCAYEVLLPEAYHAACRAADRGLRMYSLHAAVAFLQTMVNIAPADMQAVIAPFHDEQLEEYRVGFGKRGGKDVMHGVVCALLGGETEDGELLNDIREVLSHAGVGDIRVLEQRFALEYCDDCGAPLYPTPDGETAHAELPEHADAPPAHLH